MKNWEYHVEIIWINPEIKGRLDEIGSSGWELVSLLPMLSEQGMPVVPPALYAFFKRHKQ